MSRRSIAAKANVSDSSLAKFVNNRFDITCRVASNVAEVVMPCWNSKSEFVYGTELVDRLDYMTKATQNDIKVVGADCYVLDSLEDVASKGVFYQRLLTSEHLNNRLGQHLQNAARSPNFEAYATPINCRPMFVSDTDVILLLPGSSDGVYLTGKDQQRGFSKYFNSILSDDRTEKVTGQYQ